jgi:cell division protein ZapA (FtsZ GTPase activity inhibitor)
LERTRSVQLELAGQRIKIRTDADPAHLQELARTVNEQYEAVRVGSRPPAESGRVRRSANPAALAAMVALRLADELSRERSATRTLRADVRARSERILEQLNSIAAGDGRRE